MPPVDVGRDAPFTVGAAGGAGTEAVNMSPGLVAEAKEIAAAGLFDTVWYRSTYPDVATAAIDPLLHFAGWGWREGRRPNLYFDTSWYVQQNSDAAEICPLLHYIRVGEARNRSPSAFFDLPWYRARHERDAADSLLLAHYLRHRQDGTAAPLPEFDAGWYLRTYPDIGAAGVDPFEHYLRWGWREGRNPSEAFDTGFYVRRYLDPGQDENPLLHYRRLRHVLRLHTRRPASESGVHDEVRRFTRPGPAFEEVRRLPDSAPRRATVLAAYLPQFHPIAENDRWWGVGFTEWTALARALPRFAGHYQPRVPRDLGHYRLEGTEVLRRQIALARGGGLGGFIFYFYWFNGHRLLEKPLEAFLADRSLDFPFCLMWANESWTRRWDGSDQEVLIAQEWRQDDEPALIDEFARHFRDPRYLRLQGRPLLMVYRADVIPSCALALARWREAFRRRHGEDPLFVVSQSFGLADPRPHGFDGAMEFPPHKLVEGLAPRNPRLSWFDEAAKAQVFAYADVVAASLAEPPAPYPLLRTAVPGWDNDPRRQGQGLLLHEATPQAYQEWLAALIGQAEARPFFGEKLVCVNAWNEWAEGAYLEPDVHYGGAWLNATARAVAPSAWQRGPLLLVGHDAFPSGAQRLLLNLGETLRRRCGTEVEFLLLEGGRLLADYTRVAPTRVASAAETLAERAKEWAAHGVTAALVNSAAAARAIPALSEAGIRSVLLVHEMPRLLHEKRLLEDARTGAALAHRVVFAAEAVRDGFASVVPFDPSRAVVLPQGIYGDFAYRPETGTALRKRLGARRQRVAVGVGYGDLRKGFDLFLQTWRLARRRGGDVAFWWVGDIDPSVRAYLGPEIAAAEASGTFRLAGWQEDVRPWLAAADVFVLSSREDPFPSVVLEALASGLPCVAFEDSGGIPDLLVRLRGGVAVPMADAEALAQATLALLAEPRHRRTERAARAGDAFRFDRYAHALLGLARPGLAAVSVAVPGCNSARFLPARLASIFTQTHPVAEVIVLDDASRDASVAVARRCAADWQRDIRVVESRANSGSPFRQWRRAAELAESEWLWIAEADDEAEPELLAALAQQVAEVPGLELAFCDSRAVNAEGAPLWPDHRAYFASAGADPLAAGGAWPAREFARRFLAERNLILNASAVLWRRTSLLAACRRLGDSLGALRLAGDWRLYLEVLATSEGSVAMVPAPLNAHRRHRASVTGSLSAARHLEEIAAVQAAARTLLSLPPQMARKQAAYRRALARQFGAKPASARRTRQPVD